MKTDNKYFYYRQGLRFFLAILVIIPFVYFQEFYLHFHAYLTGMILAGVIKNQWVLVIFFIILFSLFAIPLSYRKKAKWLDYGLVGAFFISLFIEMYGIPLTILFASKYLFQPGVEVPENVLEFNFLGVGIGMDHAMVYGAFLMILGMVLIVAGWYVLYRQAKKSGFSSQGLYGLLRHPQYLGFVLLIIGWFFGWPTILTLIFSPILIYKYIRAARVEEREMAEKYGNEFQDYLDKTPFLF